MPVPCNVCGPAVDSSVSIVNDQRCQMKILILPNLANIPADILTSIN